MNTALAGDVKNWIEATSDGTVVRAQQASAGASRDAWLVDVDVKDSLVPLFFLRDKNRGGGSCKDAAVLRALAGSGIPVPRVIGSDESLACVLLDRIEGRSDFPQVDDEADREPTIKHLMQLTAALHKLDPADLTLQHLDIPETAHDCANQHLLQLEQLLPAFGDAIEPFFIYALRWLQAHIPERVDKVSLVHSDMGPGNFLAQGGKVTAILDWEVAHFGDPMEDLAAVAVRDMATPVGDLSSRFGEYEDAGGTAPDLQRIAYYRALILTRNSTMISLGLLYPSADFNVEEMTMYRALLIRAAALVICDCIGVTRPTMNEALSLNELDDLNALSQQCSSSLEAAEANVRQQLKITEFDVDHVATAQYFARRLLRYAQTQKNLLGELAERYPQPLSTGTTQ